MTAPPGTVVLLQGSAFATQSTRDDAATLVAERTGRPARVLAEEPAVEGVMRASLARLGRPAARTARADVQDGGCRPKSRAIATAVAERADTILRVRLDATVTTRTATEADRRASGSRVLAGMLSTVGLGDDTVYETALDGSVERTTFPGAITTARQKVRWRGRRLGRKDAPPPLEVRDALVQALAAMPTASAARWEPIARSLVSSGCPALGAAVADALVDDPGAQRRIRASAVTALAPKVEPVTPSPEVASTEVEPSPGATPEPAIPATDPSYSCSTLCTLHMVELCNNDRTLWTQHGTRFESTRCGTRRSEVFLEECYRMQWLSGTYQESCIKPCEETAEGRPRLLAMLRRSGCLHAGS